MPDLQLHHVAVITKDLDASARFYEDVLGLSRLPRPPFTVAGIWYGAGTRQIHVVVHSGTFRASRVDNDDVHFALRTDDFEATLADLARHGYRDDLPEDHPKRLIIKKSGLAGFPQVFLMDPDHNTIEINQAPT